MDKITVTWDLKGKCFVCYCPYKQQDIPSAAGFRYESRTRTWWTREPDFAKKLEPYWDETVKHVFSVIAQRRKRMEESRAVDAKIDIPCNQGLAYLPYQKAGIAFTRTHANVLNGDDMGLGKTIQAIGLINLFSEHMKKILIICPASLKLNWRSELTKWLTARRRIGIAEGPYWPNTDLVIINYDILLKHSENIRKTEWDLLVADEAQYLKNPKSLRTKALLGGRLAGGVVEKNGKAVRVAGRIIHPVPAKRKLFMTGTPISNRPAELWPLIHALDPDRWSNWKDYSNRFCKASRHTFGGVSPSLDELQRILRSTIMIRRMKVDVLTDLPPKIRQIIEIPPTTAAMRELVNTQSVIWKKHEGAVREIQDDMARATIAKDHAAYKRAVLRLTEGLGVDFTEMSRIRRETAVAKLPVLIAHIAECLESSKKIVVFAHHREVLEAVHAHFAKSMGAVIIYGGQTMEAREAAKNRFQNNPSCRVCSTSIRAGGVGITLTAASHEVFGELDWVPGNMSQAEDRCHRIGQKDSVLCQHIVLEGSIDAHMARIIVGKQSVIEQALDATDQEVPKASAMPVEQKAQPAPAVRRDSLIGINFDSTNGVQGSLF